MKTLFEKNTRLVVMIMLFLLQITWLFFDFDRKDYNHKFHAASFLPNPNQAQSHLTVRCIRNNYYRRK